MLVEIVSIGDEVLEGETVNTNAAFLARELTERGYKLGRHTVLPDQLDALEMGLKEALGRATLVIATGGLGKAFDDLTKKIGARLFRSQLQLDSKLYDDLQRRYPNASQVKAQATIPQEALLLQNSLGTAPGFLFLSTSGSLMLLPGVPSEMQQMFEGQALPLLEHHFQVLSPVKTLHLSLCLLSELKLEPLLREIQLENPDAKIGLYPSLGTLQLRFQVNSRFERLHQWEKRIREAFPTHLIEGVSLLKAVHKRLIEQKKTVALAESCTGGALSAQFVTQDGASDYLLGSLVVYSNEWKEQFLGVNPQILETMGAVSEETVIEMVRHLFEKSRADYAIAISGIAGPTGGSLEKPVGTVFIAIGERGDDIDCGCIHAPTSRASTIELSVQTALGALWRRLAYQTMTFS